MAVSFGDIDLKSGRIQPTISWKSQGRDVEPECLCREFQGRSFISKLRDQAVTQFSWSTFVKEAIYHTFFPLSIPLLLLLEGGVVGLLNRQFISTRAMGISQWAYGICCE
eukprot:TRINITY_DN1062_c0_g2_i1.p1 TRINITY_DN1062_c0_g2~~TRINITY_DN1062_c0_g2_i1.p1  ORF type:complete len:110 (+),score=3.21 TRINITY_DN1062_c0_g2_i1:197-526(+)